MLRQAIHDDRELITKGLMTQTEYDQEWYLSTDAAIKGACYTAALSKARQERRITRVPYDPILPVDTDGGLGVGDSMAIWFTQSLRSGEIQRRGNHQRARCGRALYGVFRFRHGHGVWPTVRSVQGPT